MSSYFSFFPTIAYKNIASQNVLAKVRFEESVKKHAAVFYPYTIIEGERPDQIAEHYYDDATYDWLIYLANGIVDPYHDWPKSQRVFDQYIINKYGSVAIAESQVAFYRTNEDVDERVISPSTYESQTAALKKYWEPILGYGDVVINYQRSTNTLYADTNSVISIVGTFTNTSVGDVLKQGDAYGEVAHISSDNTTVQLKHVVGTWTTGVAVTKKITGVTVSSTVTSVTIVYRGISTEEAAFWRPVTKYVSEVETNESKKEIILVHKSFVDDIEREMRDLLLV